MTCLVICERLPPLSLSEEVVILASILRADTVGAITLGITWFDVVSNSSYLLNNWGDDVLVTVGSSNASVTD